MSRTDVHRPWWVKERDPYLRRLFTAGHIHDDGGPCDIALRWANPRLPWAATRCHIRYIGWRNIFCGCRLCTDHYDRKQDIRRARVRWRQDRQVWLKGGDPRP